MTKKCIPTIVTHRGLEPSKPGYFSESSLEAFKDQLNHGFGIEFDFNRTADNQIIVLHDMNLKRITGGVDERTVGSLSAKQLAQMTLPNGSFCFLSDLIPLIMSSKSLYHVFHIKAVHQTPENLSLITKVLSSHSQLETSLLLFDLTLESAKYLHEINPRLQLAPSVAHEYDRKRFNSAVGGTLLTVKETLENKELFSGVWLDEWDLEDEGGLSKQFYIKEIVSIFKDAGLLIGLVTPELHGTSPGLLGGEAHPDSQPLERLLNRIEEIIELQPDIICTDYPDQVKALIQ